MLDIKPIDIFNIRLLKHRRDTAPTSIERYIYNLLVKAHYNDIQAFYKIMQLAGICPIKESIKRTLNKLLKELNEQ